MNILPCSSIDITNLIGALLINENGGEFYCTGIKFLLDDHTILLDLSEERNGEHFASVAFENLDNWSIQF
jgi:hypothetical protein